MRVNAVEVVITGPVGSGKSILSNRLQEILRDLGLGIGNTTKDMPEHSFVVYGDIPGTLLKKS